MDTSSCVQHPSGIVVEPDWMHGSEVQDAERCHVQTHGQIPQQHDTKLQAIVHLATFELGCEPILQSGLE